MNEDITRKIRSAAKRANNWSTCRHAETHPTLSWVAAFVRFPECQNCEQGEMIWKEVTWINKSKGEPLTVFELTL